MPTQLKRPAAATAIQPRAKRQQETKKPQEVDPIVAKCNAIIGVLRSAEGLSEATLRMLEVGAKACLAVPKESRHEVQHSVVEMIGEVLSSVEAGHAAKVEALRGRIAEADTERAKREAMVEATIAAEKEKSGALEAAEKALVAALGASAAAREAHMASVSEQKKGDADLLGAEGKKGLAEDTVRDHLAPLKSGSATNADNSVLAVVKAGKELGLEAQLLQSAEIVLRKALADRGSFDSMVTQQLDEQFTDTIAKLTELLAKGEAGKAERAGKVEACAKQVDSEVAHVKACQDQIESAKASLKEAVSTRKVAEQSAKDFGPEMEEAAANAEAADATLAACKADLATFTELVEGPPAAPEAAPVEAINPDEAQGGDVDSTPATALDEATV